MKIRISGNSLRVRLTQGEVARLERGEKVEQVTLFANHSKMVSSVMGSSQIQFPVATLEGGNIAVRLPRDRMREWANSEEVGIEADQDVGEGRSLHILVEKDFECLHSGAEREVDAFPNPLRNMGRGD
jgi:hypothetical protein